MTWVAVGPIRRVLRGRVAAPRVEIRRGARQMQDDTTDGADDVDVQEAVAQPGHLSAGQAVRAAHSRSSCMST